MATTITPERLQWFANYYRKYPTWAVFSACLHQGHWDTGASDHSRDQWPVDVREAAEWFEQLTPPQRRRLGRKAEDLAGVRE